MCYRVPMSMIKPQGTPIMKRSFTEQEAATYIALSRSFLRQSRMTGPLQSGIPAPKFIKLGSRTIRYLIEDLDQYLDQFEKHNHTHES